MTRFVANGDTGLTLIFDEPVSQALSIKIEQLAITCRQRLGTKVSQVIPAYQSLTVQYDVSRSSYNEMKNQLGTLLSEPCSTFNGIHQQGKTIEIPVCYEEPFAPDLAHVAKQAGLTTAQVIQQHSAKKYFVHMLGFSPGFLYLGGLDKQLVCPRKSVPALNLPAGSVGIGGSQTGIYPQNSPGGWQIIGRTPLPLFDIQQDPPCIAKPLDWIKFVSISEAEFHVLANAKEAIHEH